MLFLVGPPRAGKGTTSRVLQKLVGERNFTAYSLWKLAENFGLAPLVGKQVAFVGEINLAGVQKKHQILEQLNSIVGGDPVSVNAKHRDEYTVFLPSRFMFNCNEMPSFFDTTGAFAARLLVVEFNSSFAGREDTDLDRKLDAEIPGIANWALAGLADLRRAGRFTVTPRLNEAVVAIQREASTLLAFTQDCLVVQESYHNPSLPNVRTSADDLWAKKEAVWQAYLRWCEENCRELGSRVWFFRDLRVLLPKLSKERDKKMIDGKEVEIVRGLAVAPPPVA
jgi:putative DNA primase/helicase